MNPGEYEVDGVRYKWTCVGQWEHFQHFVPQEWLACSYFPDIEKAEKARQELIEAESGEWVYLMARETQIRYRIHPDGSQPQWYDDEQWTEDIDDADWAEHYRKGREVAEAEAADMRDAVRELVVEVNIYDRFLKRHGSASRNDLIIAAKKVEAKL